MRASSGGQALTGCDVQQVSDVADAVSRFGTRYLDRVYTADEQSSYRTGGAASLAARFAAKEAVLKLIGEPGGIDLRSVEIRTRANGRPEVRLSGRAAEAALAAAVGDIDVSLSHAGGLALAVAVALASPGRTAKSTGTSTGTSTGQPAGDLRHPTTWGTDTDE